MAQKVLTWLNSQEIVQFCIKCQKQKKKKENISLPTFYIAIHFLYCISINIFKFLVDYLHAIHIFILHHMVIHFLYCISINIFKFPC